MTDDHEAPPGPLTPETALRHVADRLARVRALRAGVRPASASI